MESAFGADFSGVRVHSGRTATDLNERIQAKAFTTGNDIYFRDSVPDASTSSGQELLAHELTHTIQQGAAVQRAVDGIESVRSRKERVISRRVDWTDQHRDVHLDSFATQLSNLVDAKAVVALGNPSAFAENANGYLALWADTAEILGGLNSGTLVEADITDEDVLRQIRTARSLGAARFGYAVEALASAEVNLIQAALPAGYTFELQGTRGMTRPDLIVHDNNGEEVGWFDITADTDTSRGHIFRKTGSGWRDRPYVAEIVYAPLDASQLGSADGSIGARTAIRNALGRQAAVWAAHLEGFRANFEREYDTVTDGEFPMTIADKQADVRQALSNALDWESITPADAKSLLRLLDITLSEHGWKSGGSKARGEEILRSRLP